MKRRLAFGAGFLALAAAVVAIVVALQMDPATVTPPPIAPSAPAATSASEAPRSAATTPAATTEPTRAPRTTVPTPRRTRPATTRPATTRPPTVVYPVAGAPCDPEDLGQTRRTEDGTPVMCTHGTAGDTPRWYPAS